MVADFERAVAALDRTDDSATARVFTARRHLEEPAERLADAVTGHVRRRSGLHFEPPPSVVRDVKRLCQAAREQGNEIEAANVLSRAVPDSREATIQRARAIRHCGALGACERERRLSAFLATATEAGFDIERSDLVAAKTGPESGASAEDQRNPSERNAAESEIPEPERLSSWLVGAGHNRIESWPTEK